MKKLPLILCLVAVSLFVSCEKDETNEPEIAVESQAVLGEWNVTGYKVEDGKSITEIQGQKITQNFTSTAKDYDMTVVFNNEPNTVTSDGSYTVVLTFSVLGENVTQEAPANSALESSDWQVDGSDIVMINDELETRAKVKELSENKMVLYIDFEEVVEIDSETKVTSSGELTITLER